MTASLGDLAVLRALSCSQRAVAKSDLLDTLAGAGVASRDADMKWKRKIIIGLETLMKYADKHPEAKAAMAELSRQVRHPFDPTESD